MFVLPTFGLGVIASPTVPPGTFDTATLENGQTNLDNTNILTFTVQPSRDIDAGDSITLAGLTGSQTADGSLTLSGAGATVFGSAGSWTQSTGTLVLTVDTGQTLSTGSDTVITFNLTNPATVSSGVSGVTLDGPNFTQASISGTFLSAVDIFNVTTRNTEANILASTPSLSAGEAGIAFGTDTDDFYIYDGSAWYIFNNDTNTYSLDLDGTNDYMDIPDSTALETTAFTWSAWFYCTAINRYNIIVDTATNSSFFNGYEIFVVNSTNKIRFASYSSSDAVDSTTVVSANTWYHVAATHESGSDKLYVNGTLEASGSASNFNVSDAANLRIGSSSIFSLYHQGLIDEVSFFNSALSASDVSTIYNSGVPDDISSLSPVGWWRMGDNDFGTGTTITNQGSASSIDGTLTNGPTFSTTVPS